MSNTSAQSRAAGKSYIRLRFEFSLAGQYPVQHMKSITYTGARENLANTINRVCEDTRQ